MEKMLCGKSPLTYLHPKHDHRSWEIVVNLEGEGETHFDGYSVPFAPHDISCIPPRVEHWKTAGGGYRDLWIQMPDFPSLDPTKPTFLTDNGEITSLMELIYTVQFRRDPNSAVTAELLLEAAQQMILSRLSRRHMDDRVERIVQTIIHHFQDPLFTVDDCLRDSGYCPDHLRRLFRAETGKTPHEYLTELRIRRAKKMLSSRYSSNSSVAEIAELVGFNDISYFSRIFKKATGMSPVEFAKQERDKEGN